MTREQSNPDLSRNGLTFTSEIGAIELREIHSSAFVNLPISNALGHYIDTKALFGEVTTILYTLVTGFRILGIGLWDWHRLHLYFIEIGRAHV